MDSIILTRDGAIATITLNRPAALNALSPQMNLELSEVSSELEHDDTVRCVVLQGAGDHFMAGGDVKGFNDATVNAQLRKQALERGISETHSITHACAACPNQLLQASGALSQDLESR